MGRKVRGRAFDVSVPVEIEMDALLDPSLSRHGLLSGRVFGGKYRVEQLLGRGGMGVVVSATHMAIQQRVAIKVLSSEYELDPVVRQRFLREARAAALLRSEHVVRVFDFGSTENGRPYIVMELLEGVSLSELIDQGPLPIHTAVEYALQACVALAEAHVAGVVHRDVKPENLFLTEGVQGVGVLKVLDFGISKILPRTARGHIAAITSDALLGSPAYMPPEQIRAPRDVDHRADIWALGAVLYEALTSKPAFMADTLPELFRRIDKVDPEPMDAHRRGLPDALKHVTLRCLEKSPGHRYANVGDLAQALRPLAAPRARHYADSVMRILPPSSSTVVPLESLRNTPTLRQARRKRVPSRWVMLFGCVSVAIGLALGVATVLSARVRPPEASSEVARGPALRAETRTEQFRPAETDVETSAEPEVETRRPVSPPVTAAPVAIPRPTELTAIQRQVPNDLPDYGSRK
jgi:eukaryotic-like serine/threonine-protein kinase